ncbi:MAG: helix-turn-helix domain-containing protein [Catonella sp.]|uniref:helix-turn-helix domain-containing protein n=1 Tax=Catonella sp. TaxID=2382125 RepID=UPI003FA139D3
MDSFEELVRQFVPEKSVVNEKFCSNGKSFYADNEFFKGDYWYYESNDFIIDIHNFYIKKEYIETEIPDMSAYMYLISNYLISGSGEWLRPYQTIEPKSIFIMCTKNPAQRYVLHAKSHFFVVGMKFKKIMIENYLVKKKGFKLEDAEKIFLDTKQNIIEKIGKIADEIIHCKMNGISADLFFDAKAKEWLSIILDAYESQKKNPLPNQDIASLNNIASYINDHYAYDISQSLLEKIAMMSGTKLKYSFKNHFHMTITEYIQRRRTNIAENLLLTTDLEIKDIAKSVGYKSASRFSTIFKRYKGVLPKEVRTLTKDNV